MPLIFEKSHRVTPIEIDEMGHVNNEVYLTWFNQIATAHSHAQGWPTERYFSLGCGWVVRKHEIEYLSSAVSGEALMIKTWITTLRGSSSLRHYEVRRTLDQSIIAKGSTLWVWINMKSGRPERIPHEVANDFEIVREIQS